MGDFAGLPPTARRPAKFAATLARRVFGWGAFANSRQKAAAREPTTDDGLPCAESPGRLRRRSVPTFDPDWREPKLPTIFVHDAQGRMARQAKVLVDGAFEGPDALAELAAMHLHRLGAAKALGITFVADGAAWIWERLPQIVRLAGLGNVPLYEVLDCCHAAPHVSLALAGLGYADQQRMAAYRQYRALPRNGQWRQVARKLADLAARQPEGSAVWTEIAYLRKHGEAGRLKYPTFRRLGLPGGSGAIERNIRRVINQRLKDNGIYWLPGNAEAMLPIRAMVLTPRWDKRRQQVRRLRARDTRTAWRWTPQYMTSRTEGPPQSKT